MTRLQRLRSRLCLRWGYVSVDEVQRLLELHLAVERAGKDWARVQGLRDGLDESFEVIKRAENPTDELRAHLHDYARATSDARKPVEWPAMRDRGNAYAELVVQLETRYRHAGLQDVFIAATGGSGRLLRQPLVPAAFEYSGASR